MTVPQRGMTKTEREELKRLARERARVAKADVERRAADLKALFEQDLIQEYQYDRDEVWKEATEEAARAVEEAQARITARCEELGIPREFAPSLAFTWRGKGIYALRGEQADLRRAAYKRIEAMERTARHEIDRKALEVQTALVEAGLTSERAVEFLRSMPSVDSLMPEVTVAELERPDRRELPPGGELFGA